jgi:hypothetical protein
MTEPTQPEVPNDSTEYRAVGERIVSFMLVNAIAAGSLIASFWATALFFRAVHGRELVGGVTIAAAGAIVALLPVHELLHGLGFRIFGRLPWSQIRLGIAWKVLTPYATFVSPISARAYAMAAALPGITLGLLPMIAGLIAGLAPLTVIGLACLLSATGDAAVLWELRRIKAHTLVLDHAEKIGFRIMEKTAG